ncbi:enoyl-CoA hydratase/isomerase family protein [Bhargavaea ginsengi]|uniref:enoyl-CoA hydratase/isomerase family protein n=1 Tax=Bhargavaea ginsengi TaxID=426757 RepID=UPI003C7333F8
MVYRFEKWGSGAVFTIDRPEKRNAINDEVMDALSDAIKAAGDDESLRYFVITGEGQAAFCSGGDLSEFHKLRTEEDAAPMLGKMADILLRLALLPIPVIALIDGHAVGGGCEIATACDFRIVREDVRCGFIQGTLAITTGWGGATHLLHKSGRQDTALRMLMEARPKQAPELLEAGWATELYTGDKFAALSRFTEPMERVHPSVHRAYKKAAVRRYIAGGLPEQVREEVSACAKLWAADVHHEAVDAFLNKKK